MSSVGQNCAVFDAHYRISVVDLDTWLVVHPLNDRLLSLLLNGGCPVLAILARAGTMLPTPGGLDLKPPRRENEISTSHDLSALIS